MSFTEVTNQNWFSRMGGAIKGIVFGAILVLISFPLLFWNEGRAVHRARTLAEGRGLVVADVPIESVDANNEGKLVHMTGTATSTTPASGSLTRSALTHSPNGLRRPYWLKRPLKPVKKAYEIGE